MSNIHLITGGNGFLGNLITRRLLEKNHKVRVLDIWDSPERPPEAEFVHCDVLDRNGVAKAMQGVGIVHHNAALVPLTKAGGSFFDVNLSGSRIVAEEAVRAGVNAFVHMSSSTVFGKPACPVTSATPLQPFETYGRAKLAGEQAVQDICGKNQLPLICIRPRTILGDGRLGIFQILFEWIREGRKIYLIGKGDNLFQFVHAHDLIDFYMLAVEGEAAGNYNVGAQTFRTLREDMEALINGVDSASRVIGLPAAPAIAALQTLDILRLSPLTSWHYKTYHLPFYFDIAPLLAMGWQPRYSNAEMFLESYRWFEANYDTLRAQRESDRQASAHRRPVREGVLKLLKKLS